MSARARLFVALVSTCLVGYIALGSVLGRVLGDTSYSQLTVFNEVVRLVLDSYVDPVNVDRAMAGAELGLTEALDGDTAYLDAEALKAYQQPPKESDAEIGLVLSRRFGFLAVVAPRPGSPAAKAGVKAGDIIKTIDGRHSRTVTVPEGERLLRGAPGTTVKLRLLRQGSDPVDVSVVRERVAPDSVHGRLLEGGPGYVKVGEFSTRIAEELAAEVETLKKGGARSLVLDLRGAAYGTPESGVKAAEIFLKGGVVTRLIGRRVDEKVLNADPARSVWDLPVAVLIDGGTAGPGEIVAAALLDAGRSSIIGERTFGRAPVQKLVPLPDGALLLTVAKYVSPKGNAIHGKGVEPTVPVASAEEDDEDATQPARDAVLVDSGTAGPGEIVAAALLDAGRSSIIGERTFGRAPVQKLVPLPDGALLLTVAKYVSPKGNAIHGKGVEPTVPVASAEEDDEDAAQPAKDAVLEKAIEVLTADAKKAA